MIGINNHLVCQLQIPRSINQWLPPGLLEYSFIGSGVRATNRASRAAIRTCHLLSSAPSLEPPPVNSGGQRWPATVNDARPPPQQLSDQEDFKFQIDSRQVSAKKKELLPFHRFTKLIIKHILSQHNKLSKRPQSFHHVIKLDSVLGNLKFANKGAKDPIYGMTITMEIMSDEIKASVHYLNYLAKSEGEKLVKCRGKGLLTKKGVEVAMEKIKTKRVLNKKRTKAIIKETVISRQAHKDSDEGTLDHSKKLKGVEALSNAAQYLLDMKTATKASRNDFVFKQRPICPVEGSGMIPEVLDAPSGSSSSSSSKSEDSEGFLPTDDEASPDNVPEPHVEKPAVPHPNSSLTLSSVEYGNQFINDNPDVSLTDVLKDKSKIEIQSMVEVLVLQENPAVQIPPLVDTTRLIKLEKKVDRMSKINHTNVIETSVQPNMMNNTTPITLYQPPSTSANRLTEYEIKLKLYNMIQSSRSFLDHEKHLTLYNALINSMDIDEANVQGNKDTKKRGHDKQDPPTDVDNDSKKRKRKDADTSSSKKEDEELIQYDVEDDDEMVQDDDIAADDMTHDDDSPTQDRSTWFKKDVMLRPETLDPENCKEPNVNDALEQNWFNEMVNAKKDLVTFNDLMGFTIDFTKFSKNCLKKDKLTKADLEGPIFKLLKGNYRNCIELEYNMEQHYLALTYQIDWANHEGDNAPEQKEYVFKEADFPKLHLNDIEDMYLMYAQNKLHHLKGDEQTDLVMALRFFIRRIIFKKRVKDIQLRVEIYQTNLNITRPQVRCDDLDLKEPYTILYKPKGVVYLNKYIKYPMRVDELYKFSDGTLKPVRDILNLRLHNFELGYNNTSIPKRAWTENYQKRTTSMLEKIGQTLLKR
ncbi:hypothetical protein Tco_0849122 [Tanacetum coccineum]